MKGKSRGGQADLSKGKHQGAVTLEEEAMQHIQRLGQQLMHQLQC